MPAHRAWLTDLFGRRTAVTGADGTPWTTSVEAIEPETFEGLDTVRVVITARSPDPDLDEATVDLRWAAITEVVRSHQVVVAGAGTDGRTQLIGALTYDHPVLPLRVTAPSTNPFTLLFGPGSTSPATGTSTGDPMSDFLRQPLGSPWAVAGLLATCALLGAAHALTPGHGKALLAAYLVGGRVRPRHAVVLGITITATHTAAVIGLGVAVLVAGRYLLPEVVTPVLTTIAGALVLGLGIRLFRSRWINDRDLAAAGHGHGHGHGHATGFRGVTAVGLSAGLIPCPEALGVLLLAVGLNRTALGLVMIVAFSAGLAAVLVVLGLVVITGAPWVTRLGDRAPAWAMTRLPLASAGVVAVLGGVMLATGISSLAA